MARSEDVVYRLVEEIYGRTRSPVSLPEILSEARRRGLDLKERTVRYALGRLTDKGMLVRVGRRPMRVVPSKPGASLEVYLETPRDAGAVTSEREEEEWEVSLARSIAREIGWTEEFLRRVEENAEYISEEDPVTALVEMASWLSERYNYLVARMDALPKSERARAEHDLERIRRLIFLYMGSVLSIPVRRGRADTPPSPGSEGDSCGSGAAPIIFRPPSRSAGERSRGYMIVCRDLLERLLRRVVIGRRIVEERPFARTDRIAYLSGQDTSYWPVKVGEIAGSVGRSYRGPPIYIFAGILYRTWRSGRLPGPKGGEVLNSWDIVPRPAELPTMDVRSAVSQGYVLPPNILSLVPESMIKRTAEAQMNVLEYNLMLQLLRPGELDSLEYVSPPLLPPDVILHDGRLFPYEHKLDDFSYYYPHGNIVRRSVFLFWEVVQMADRYGERTSVVGVVKRVGTPFLLPVVAWILYRRGVIDKNDFLDAATSPYLEQMVVTALFSALMDGRRGLPRGRTLRTFAVVRSLWAMDDKLLSAAAESAEDPEDTDDPRFWLERAAVGGEGGLRAYAEKEALPEGSEEILAQALAKAKIAVFYYCPPVRRLREDVSLPRTEVLLPYSDRSLWESRIDAALLDSTRPDPRGVRLVGYELYPLGSVEGAERYLILPDHIYQAHHYSRIYDADLRGRYLNYLVQLVARILRGA